MHHLRLASLLTLLSVLLALGCSSGGGGGTSSIGAPSSPASQSVTLGSSVSFSVSAAEGSTLSVAPLPLPQGMTFSLATGVLSFSPVQAQAGQQFELTFTASLGGQSASSVTVINVLAAPAGSPTQLSGEVRGSENQQPLSGVALRIPLPGGGEVLGSTNAQGRFLFTDLPAGAGVLEVDGSTAAEGNYTFVAENLELVLGHMVYPEQLNVIERPIYLPLLGPSAGTLTNGGGTLVSAAVPEVKVQVPSGSAKLADGTTFSGDMFIPEVAAAFTPAALPETMNPGLVVAIQPAGLTFSPPAAITFPNLDNLEPGSEVDIWSIDAGTGLFEVAGTGRVTSDGASIETIQGGISGSSWHFALPGPSGIDTSDAIDKDGLQSPEDAGQCPANSAVEASAGALMVDHRTPSYWSAGAERSVRLNYHSDRAAPRPIINTDISLPSQTATPNAHGSKLEIAGLAQPFEVFTEADGGGSRVGVFFDATSFATGIYPFNYQVTNYYDASSVGSEVAGSLLVHSEANSPFGAGWMVDGLQRVHPVAGTDEVVITGGDASATVFTPQQPLGGDLRVELAFAIDGSGSVGSGGFALQTSGIAAAVLDPTIVPPDGTVAISVTQFASNAQVEVPLTVVDSEATAQALAAQIGSIGFNQGGTNIAAGLDVAAATITPGFATARQVLCLITDGQSNEAAAEASALAAIAAGVEEIDSIGVGSGINQALLELVSINGAVTIATDFQQVAGAIAEKLRLVIGGAPSGEFSYVLDNGDGTLTRVYKDGSRVEFDSDGLQTARLDRNGNKTDYIYDVQALLVEVVDPVGKSTRMRYIDGRLSEVEDPMGRITRLAHNGLGQLVRIEDPDGEFREFEYDSLGCMTKETNRSGGVAEYRFNDLGRIDSVLLQDGTERSYTAGDLAALVADPTTTSVVAPSPKVTESDVTTTYTDGAGNTSTFLTDGFGRFVREEDALGRVTTVERNADGLPSTITRPDGAKTSITYDLRGNPLTITEQGTTSSTLDDRTWSFTYEPDFNQLRSVVDPKGNVNATTGVTTLIEYDPSGNPIRITDVMGTVTELHYDEAGFGASGLSGLLTSITEAVGLPEERTTRYRYNSDGLLVELTDPVGRTSGWSYDGQGRVVGSTTFGEPGSADDQLTTYGYDTLNQIISITDALGGVTRLDYDEAGNLLEVRDAKLPTGITRFAYDERDRLITRTDPLGAVESYNYDNAGNLLRFVDRKGQVFTWTYDAVNRPLSKQYPGEPGTGSNETVAYQYDTAGKLSRIEDADSVLQFIWTGFGELDEARTAGSALQEPVTAVYDYDRNGNRTLARLTGAGSVSDVDYFYDSLDRLERLFQDTGDLDAKFTYDELSQRRAMTRTFGGVGIGTTYDYTTAGDLLLLEHRYAPTGANTLLSSFGYGYNTLGNRTALTQDRPALGLVSTLSSFGYDSLNRLTGATQPGSTDEAYSYDEVGNRLNSAAASGAWSYNAANQLQDDGTYTYKYDANGNRIERRSIADPTSATLYYYDPENRLMLALLPDGRFATHAYDGVGRRIQQSFFDVDSSLIEKRTYYYDDEDIVFEQRSFAVGSDEDVVYTHGPGVDEALFVDGGIGARAIMADGLGSLTEEVDSSGISTLARRYDTFGKVIAESGAALSSYSYTGREEDLGTGLLYYRARHLDTHAGAFIQEDPHRARPGEPKGQASGVAERLFEARVASHNYAYAESSPQMYTDPEGNYPVALTVCATPLSAAVCAAGAATAIFVAWQASQSSSAGLGLEGLPDFSIVLMAKGGKQNIRNEYSDMAKLYPDPCKYLRDAYNNARDKAERKKIYSAQKALGCRKNNQTKKK